MLALLLLSWVTVAAQNPVVAGATKVWALTSLSNGSKILIKNAGGSSRDGYVHESDGRLLINTGVASLSDFDETYVFTVSDLADGKCYLTAASGNKVSGVFVAGTPMATVEEPEGLIELSSEGANGRWDFRIADSNNWFNTNTNAQYGAFVNTYTVQGDANATWEIFAVEDVAAFEPVADAAYQFSQSGGRVSYLPGANSMSVYPTNQTLDLSNLFTITREKNDAGCTLAYIVRSQVDPTVHVRYNNTSDADGNVSYSTDDNDANMRWRFLAAGSNYVIIPVTGTNGWNKRGTESVYGGSTLGQWGGGTNGVTANTNQWTVSVVDEAALAGAAEAYKSQRCASAQTYYASLKENGVPVGYPKDIMDSYAVLDAETPDALELLNVIDIKRFLDAKNLKTPESASGIYMIRNLAMGSDYYLFQDSEEKNVTFMDQPGDDVNAKYYFRVEFSEGAQNMQATVTASNGKPWARGAQSGRYADITEDNLKVANPATLKFCDAEGCFYIPGCHYSNQTYYCKDGANTYSKANPLFMTTWTGEYAGVGNRFSFEAVELGEALHVYNVVFTGEVPEGLAVSYSGEYGGNAKVYSGGFYVLPSAPTADDLTLSEDGFRIVSVSEADGVLTIRVASPTATDEEIAAAREALEHTGVGYPAAGSAVREALQTVLGTEDIRSMALAEAVQAFKASTDGIEMPVDGEAYIIYNVQRDGTKFVLTQNGTSQQWSTDLNADNRVVAIYRELAGGKCALVDVSGKYLIWQGGGNGGNSNNGLVDDFGYTEKGRSDWAQFTLAKLVTNGLQVGGSPVTQDALFGYMSLKGLRIKDNIVQENYVIAKHECAFDQADSPYFTDVYSSALLFEKATYNKEVTLNAAAGIDGIDGIATWSAPYPTVVPAGLTAYYVSTVKDDNTQAVTARVTEAAIPGNTGVLLTGATGTYSMLPAAGETVFALDADANLLAHSAGAPKVIPSSENAFILTKPAGEDAVAFYPLSSDESQRTIAANRAYLRLGGAQAAARLTLRFGSATAIDGVATQDASAPVYDLSGRLVQTVTKGGVYIQNGRKFIVR